MTSGADSRFESLTKALSGRDLPPLVPRSAWDEALSSELRAAGMAEVLGAPIEDASSAECVRSALLLWNDALEPSHVVSQQIDTPTGSYLHGLMHRREPDYGNAKYWFRRVGAHPLFPDVLEAAQAVLPENADAATTAICSWREWKPSEFIDMCEAAEGRDDTALRLIQVAEIRILLAYVAELATAPVRTDQ